MLIGISGKIGTGKDTIGQIIQYLTIGHEGLTVEEFIDHYKKTGIYLCDDTKKSNWEIKKFAGKLKQIVALLTGCTVEDLESQEFKSKPLSEDWVNGSERVSNDIPTYRWLLQRLGTEVMRDMVHENVWVNALFADYKLTADPKVSEFLAAEGLPQSMNGGKADYPNWIITDMRFENEARAIKQRGGLLIRVERTPFTVHHSKTGERHDLSREAFTEHPSETALDNYHGFDCTVFNNGTIEDLVNSVRTLLKDEGII